MNAEDAKKLALSNKKAEETSRKIRAEGAESADIKILEAHFRNKISDAVAKGLLSTSPIELDSSRFSDRVVQTVADNLDADGFSLAKNKHNAYQKTSYIISWA